MEILKLKKIVWILIVFLALCGCGMKEEKQAGEKLFWAIEENNVQGVKSR
ncbi:MAG: hypothetical protein ACI4S2_08340 [Lachnospiraceae bacterium]